LFLRRGMVAWMRAWPKPIPPDVQKRHHMSVEGEPTVGMVVAECETATWPLEVRDHVVAVLVNMILQTRKEKNLESSNPFVKEAMYECKSA
jgi:hypothetical protein